MAKLRALAGVWGEKRIAKQIDLFEGELGGRLSASRKKRVFTRLSELRKALAGKRTVGGQRPKDPRRVKKKALRYDGEGGGAKRHLAAGVKKTRCLRCRKYGHRLADCAAEGAGGGEAAAEDDAYLEAEEAPGAPQAGAAAAAGPICYRCGSAEHRLQDCPARSLPAGELPFASCFQCGQTGHLISQCAENPNGVYPNGGACLYCNSIYHLVANCPDKKHKHFTDRLKKASAKRKELKAEKSLAKLCRAGAADSLDADEAWLQQVEAKKLRYRPGGTRRR